MMNNLKYYNIQRLKIIVFTVLIWSGFVFTKISFEVDSGCSLTANLDSFEDLYESKVISTGGDTFEYLLPAFGIYTYGNQYVAYDGALYEWCRRSFLSSALFSVFMFIFKSSFPVFFVIFFTLSSAITFALLLFEFNQRSFKLNAIISIITGFLSYQYISRLETNGIIFFLLCLLIILFKKIHTKPKFLCVISTVLILIISLIRMEMIIILIIFSIFIFRSEYRRLSLIPLVALLAVGSYFIIKNQHCFDSGGFWIWTYRNILIYEIRNQKENDGRVSKDDINKVKIMLGDEAKRHFPPLNDSTLNFDNYFNFIIGHVYPYQNNIHHAFKYKTIQYLKDKLIDVLPFISYRILLKNPYMLIFSTPDRDLLYYHFRIPNSYLSLSFLYLYSLILLFSLLYQFRKANKNTNFILFSYIILVLLYSFYFPFGGINGGRIRCFLLPFEAPIIILFIQKITNGTGAKATLLEWIAIFQKLFKR